MLDELRLAPDEADEPLDEAPVENTELEVLELTDEEVPVE